MSVTHLIYVREQVTGILDYVAAIDEFIYVISDFYPVSNCLPAGIGLHDPGNSGASAPSE